MNESERNPRILIVDDDDLIRALMGTILKSLGADIVGEAANGKDAVSAFSTLNPDLTLLDIQMPLQNGIDALREIRKLDGTAEVVMLTANDDTVVAESCIHAGARTYIKKGEAPAELVPVMQSIIESLEIR